MTAAKKPGGHWPRKWVWGCAALKTPFSRISCRSQGSHFKVGVSSQDPLLRKFGNFSLYSLNFCPNFSSQAPKFENFSSQAPKFGNFQLTSPQIGKFSVHKPPFSEANIRSQAPHFRNSGCTPLPEKSWVPPPGLRSSAFLRFLYWTESLPPPPSKVRGLQMTINLALG